MISSSASRLRLPADPTALASPVDDDAAPGPHMPDAGAHSDRHVGWMLIGGGGLGLAGAAVLLVEKIALLRDPSYVPSCSINPILSCGSVMSAPQAEAFGIPNPIIGVAGFAAAVTAGCAVLATSGQLARWFWFSAQTAVTLGVGFVHWLVFQSLYRIGALYPYCMVVWAVTIPLFVAITTRNLRAIHHRLSNAPAAVAGFAAAYSTVIVKAWFLAIAALIAERFWSYWITLLP